MAEKINVKWEDFALISPDYWRKYLLDYDTMGEDYKYAAMMTGHELEIIDRKLDSYVAAKARRHNLPHLLLDRFRFDSFKVGDDGDYQSKLLSRFGTTVLWARAASATPCAWLPEENAMTPRARCASVRADTAAQPPRNLKLPVCHRSGSVCHRSIPAGVADGGVLRC